MDKQCTETEYMKTAQCCIVGALSPCIDCLALNMSNLFMFVCVYWRLEVFTGVSTSTVEHILSYTSVPLKMDTFHSLCSTNGTMTGTGQWAFCLVMVIIKAVILVFTAVVLSSVVAANAIRDTIRLVLANLLIASITACIGIGLICLCVLISINSHLLSPTDISFKIFLATTAIGGNGRSAFMAVFAVVVVIIIKSSNSAVKFRYLLVSVVVVWIACPWCHRAYTI